MIYYGNRWFVGGYANDTWKIRPNFTLNLGIRLEHETVPLGEHSQTLNAVSNTPGVIMFQNPQAQRINPMPRVGLAYSPGKSGKTSIRAGFGISYDVAYDNQGILSLPPELSTTVDVTGFNQGGFLANGGIAPNATGVALTPAQLKAGTGSSTFRTRSGPSHYSGISASSTFSQTITRWRAVTWERAELTWPYRIS